MKTKKFIAVISCLALLGSVSALSACNPQNEPVEPPVELVKSIKIDEAKTSVAVDSTIELHATVENVENPVILWSSKDTKIATVSESGVVTGVTMGEVEIEATVQDYADLVASVKITVTGKAMTKLEIKDLPSEVWGYVGTEVDLEYTFEPADALDEVVWSSSNPEAVSVDEKGHVVVLDKGEADIKVACGVDNNVFASIKVAGEYVIDETYSGEAWDFSGLKSSKPSIKTNGMNTNDYALFNGVQDQYYVIDATVSIEGSVGDDTWSRVSLGSVLKDDSNTKFHGFMVSPGPAGNARKTVLMDIVNKDVQWGIRTDRSQVWGQHGLYNRDFTNFELTTIRYENDFYYFIDQELYYKETIPDFEGVPTIPAIHAHGVQATFSNISEIDGEQYTSLFLNPSLLGVQANKKFYATDSNNVVISEDETSIQFKNANNGAPTNMKDNAAKTIGDALLIPSNKNVEIEFDYTFDAFGSTDNCPALVVSTNRWDNQYAEARSWVIAEEKAGFSGWNSNGDLNAGIGDGGQAYATSIVEGTTYHAKLSLLPLATGADMVLETNGITRQWGWDGGGYVGNYVLNFATRNLDATISNLTFNIAE